MCVMGCSICVVSIFFFFQAEDGIRDLTVTGVQTCALPIFSEAAADEIAGQKKILKYPSTVKIYLPNGQAPKAGDILRNPDLARTLRKLVEAEKANASKGHHEALKAARDLFYKGDIARELAARSEERRVGK